VSIEVLSAWHVCVVCSDCVFVILYIYMAEHWISPQQLLLASMLLTVVGYLCNTSITGLSADVPGIIWTCEYAQVYRYLWLQLLLTVVATHSELSQILINTPELKLCVV